MAALEIKKLRHGSRLCEACLAEPGPSRMATFAVYLLGRPADEVCPVHRARYVDLFERKARA